MVLIIIQSTGQVVRPLIFPIVRSLCILALSFSIFWNHWIAMIKYHLVLNYLEEFLLNKNLRLLLVDSPMYLIFWGSIKKAAGPHELPTKCRCPTHFFMVMDRVPMQKTHDRCGKKSRCDTKPSSLQTWLKMGGKADRDHSKRCSQLINKSGIPKQSHARSKSHQLLCLSGSQKASRHLSFQRNELLSLILWKYVCLILSSGTWKWWEFTKIIKQVAIANHVAWLERANLPQGLTSDTQPVNLRNEWAVPASFSSSGSLSWKSTDVLNIYGDWSGARKTNQDSLS